MQRRHFLALSGAAALLPMSTAAQTLNFKPGLVEERLAAGETVFLVFQTHWCTTCRAQGRVIGQLKADNPSYEEAITFVDVDWDEHSRSDLANRLNIPRRSTLVVLKGDQELGRIVAGTATADIKRLMDIALNA